MGVSGYFVSIGLGDFNAEQWIAGGVRRPSDEGVVWFVILSMTALFPSLLHAIALPEALYVLSRGGAGAEAPSGIASILSAPAVIVFVIGGVIAVLDAVGIGWLSLFVLNGFSFQGWI